MRYILQKEKYDCAPTAIFNAVRYYNPYAKMGTFNRIKAICRVNPYTGTEFQLVCEAVRKFLVVSGEMLLYPKIEEVLPYFINNVGVFTIHHNNFQNCHTFFVERYLPEIRKLIVSGLRPGKRRTHVNVKEVKDCAYVFFIRGINDSHHRFQGH